MSFVTTTEVHTTWCVFLCIKCDLDHRHETSRSNNEDMFELTITSTTILVNVATWWCGISVRVRMWYRPYICMEHHNLMIRDIFERGVNFINFYFYFACLFISLQLLNHVKDNISLTRIFRKKICILKE